MQFLTGKRIIFGISGLLVVLILAGWLLFGSNLLKLSGLVSDAPPGSTIDAECAPVYQKIKTEGFIAHRLMAEDGFIIEKALFVSGQEAKSRYNSQLQVPDDARLCYVLVRGNIEVGSPFTTTVAIYPTGSAIYDLQTMSYLAIGAGRNTNP